MKASASNSESLSRFTAVVPSSSSRPSGTGTVLVGLHHVFRPSALGQSAFAARFPGFPRNNGALTVSINKHIRIAWTIHV
jgi:hypothetical protein